MKKTKILLAVLIISATACTSSNDFLKAKKQLESQGYTDVEKTGWESFCCGKDDQFATGFKAKDKNGNEVKGCICSSLGKGITIRYE